MCYPAPPLLISISETPANERGPQHTRAILAAIHHAASRRFPISLLFARRDDSVGLFCRFPEPLDGLVQRQFHAKYPDSAIETVPDDAFQPAERYYTWSMNLTLRPDLFPILRYQQFEDSMLAAIDDPVGGVLQTLAPDGSTLRARIELVIRPASQRRCRRAQHAVELLARPFFRSHRRLARRYALMVTSAKRRHRALATLFGIVCATRSEQRGQDDELSKTSSRMHDSEKDLQAGSVKLGQHLFESQLRIVVQAAPDAQSRAHRKLREIAAVLNKFTVPRLGTFHCSTIRGGELLKRDAFRRGFLLSDEEIATLWHPPTKSVRDTSMHATHSRRFEPPAELPLKEREPAVCELGRVTFQSRADRFGIRTEDRLRHIFIAGKTGMGKSTVLYNAIVSDMAAGYGLAVIDPHGDLADAVLSAVPSYRTNDVIVIDPADVAFPVGINPLDVEPSVADLACDGMVSTFRKVFGTGIHTPRLEDILWNTVLALMLSGTRTLLDVLRMFGPDDTYRQSVLSQVSDPLVLNWWRTTFPKLQSLKGEDPFASVENKLRQLLTSPVIRNIVAQPETRINFRDAMDRGKILIVNLSKGRLGERTSSFLGSLIVTQLQLAAMSRADIPERDRRLFFLYVDEFHNVTTSSFASILSEARKYRLGLCIATQYLDQVDEQTLQAVFGNVGSMLAFAVGPNDAERLAEQLGGGVTAADLVALPKYRAYVRLMIDGVSKPAFSMETIEPVAVSDAGRADRVRRQSRRQYARPVETVAAGVRGALVLQ